MTNKDIAQTKTQAYFLACKLADLVHLPQEAIELLHGSNTVIDGLVKNEKGLIPNNSKLDRVTNLFNINGIEQLRDLKNLLFGIQALRNYSKHEDAKRAIKGRTIALNAIMAKYNGIGSNTTSTKKASTEAKSNEIAPPRHPLFVLAYDEARRLLKLTGGNYYSKPVGVSYLCRLMARVKYGKTSINPEKLPIECKNKQQVIEVLTKCLDGFLMIAASIGSDEKLNIQKEMQLSKLFCDILQTAMIACPELYDLSNGATMIATIAACKRIFRKELSN